PPLARCRRAGPGHAASRRADRTRRVVHGAAPPALRSKAPRRRRRVVGTRPAPELAVITVSGWADTLLLCIVLTRFGVLFACSLAGSLWLAGRLALPSPTISPLVVPVALFTMLVGLFLIVSRRKALTQVLGYLVLENAIYAFGVGLVEGTPMVVELGVLLDLFVAVFVMGIAVFHINREFDHIDADRLSTLRDWAG